METLILKKMCIKKEIKSNSFFELAKNHIIKSNKTNKNLSLDINKIVYDL